jgi:hypothetical protein
MRLLIAFCVGIAATLAWQSYGDTARAMIAGSYPQLDWLAPHLADAQAAPAAVVPPGTSPEDIKAMAFSLAAMRQRVDQLAASQNQITRDITAKVQVAKQEILDKISAPSPQPATPPARKPTPQAPPVH